MRQMLSLFGVAQDWYEIGATLSVVVQIAHTKRGRQWPTPTLFSVQLFDLVAQSVTKSYPICGTDFIASAIASDGSA